MVTWSPFLRHTTVHHPSCIIDRVSSLYWRSAKLNTINYYHFGKANFLYGKGTTPTPAPFLLLTLILDQAFEFLSGLIESGGGGIHLLAFQRSKGAIFTVSKPHFIYQYHAIDVSTSHLQTSALSSMQWLNYPYYIYWGLIWWVARPGHDLYPSSHLRISSLWFRILFILMTRGARLLIHASGLQVRRGKQKKCERVLENIPPISNYWVFISNVERKSKRGGGD